MGGGMGGGWQGRRGRRRGDGDWEGADDPLRRPSAVELEQPQRVPFSRSSMQRSYHVRTHTVRSQRTSNRV